MSNEFHATYADGVLKLDVPLALPEQARVTGLVTGVESASGQPIAPAASGLTDEEFEGQMDDLALDVPPLPADFSRADIYLDHD
jgi:hypothetical protein